MDIVDVNEKLSLHPLRSSDHARHYALLRRIYPPAFSYLWPDNGEGYVERIHGYEAFIRDLAEPDTPYYRVEWDGRAIGILRLQLHYPYPGDPEVPALKLDRLYLGPEARGRGVGTSLLRYTLDLAGDLGKRLVWLERMESNEATVAFYRSRGFRDGGAFRYDGPDMLDQYRGMRRLWYPLT
ncbi:GNAT family N-acetyltransferase [Lewinella sp. W8]|uniref:GNAT family N-acetyltransferase n=1 Tax=Lewinella sp. W8 TaxID=2528208 RepID=UPI001565912A